MYTIIYQLNGVESYRKTLPMGSQEELLEASQEFHCLVHDTTESHPFSRDGDDEDLLLDPVVSDAQIDHYENNGEAFSIKDDEGNVHTFQMIRG